MDLSTRHVPEDDLIIGAEVGESPRPPGDDPALAFSPAHKGGDNDDYGFSNHYSDDEPQGFSLGPGSTRGLPPKQFTKLEVVKAKQIERLLNAHYLVIGMGVLYTLLKIILVNTVYLGIWETPKDQGYTFDWRAYNAPIGFQYFSYVIQHVLFAYAFMLTVVFSVRIFSLRRTNITHEMVWTVVLLVSISCYLLPVRELILLHDLIEEGSDTAVIWKKTAWYSVLKPVLEVIQRSGFAAATIFYVWSTLHSYRKLEKKITPLFYVPKIVALCIYVAAKVAVVFKYEIYSAELPLSNLPGMLSLYYTADKWDTAGVIYGCLISLADLFFLGICFYEMRRTKAVLKKADYLHYRSKQIGFRFFMYHNITFYLVYVAVYITLQMAVPNGATVHMYRNVGVSVYGIHRDLVFGLNLMLLAYVTTEAYGNLPADALGFKGWFRPQIPKGIGADASELEPITYRKREPPSLHGVVPELNVNCFIMQTHVTMFNFAWLVYYWDTPKVDNFKLTQDVFKFKIASYIKDKPTDTHALVVDGVDRIVIAFKGTTSTQNLKTDINMFYSSARTVIPTQIGEMDPEGDQAALDSPVVNTKEWKRAKIHKGFATAYRAVGPELLSVVKKLMDVKRRPIFLTGHSLGGALATVCSLDLFVRLGLTRREIFVSTFGAPRVGNRPFHKTYDAHVPIHWRIVVGPDVVAKLPKLGFIHIGKKVLLTVDGDLFIDPNSLELNLWSGDAASILYHRKASYLLAMRAWCERHHGDEYVPEFWPFPVSKDDTRRFQHAMTKSNLAQGNSMVISMNLEKQKQKQNKNARLLKMDAMIDALDGPPPSKRACELWGSLTRRLLAANVEPKE